ncbi:hypothetical protein ACLOJK_001827 [Asimina triloba]
MDGGQSIGAMAASHVLHMNGGYGDTSYAQNSKIQNKIISIAKPITEEAIVGLCGSVWPKSLGIADLGCSSGPNTLLVISEIIDVIHQRQAVLNYSSTPELRVYLNDLPANDFNSVFQSLPAFYNKLRKEKGANFGPCFIAGVPGTFYGRLFPTQSLHFVHSSSSLHWLSQAIFELRWSAFLRLTLESIPLALGCLVPPELNKGANPPLNRGKIFISTTSPPSVFKAYLEQFQRDFSVFLMSRSEEVIPGGRMVFSFVGRRATDPSTEESCHQWELLAQALNAMVLDGVIEEEKVDSFNAPYYSPSLEELTCEIEKQGSFMLDRFESYPVDWDASDLNGNDYSSSSAGTGRQKSTAANLSRGQRVSKTIRAVVESMLVDHFGEDAMDGLFQRYSQIVDQRLSESTGKYVNVVISLIRKEE